MRRSFGEPVAVDDVPCPVDSVRPEAATWMKLVEEPSIARAVRLALQHLSGLRHFVRALRYEDDPNEPTKPASDLRQAKPERSSAPSVCGRRSGRSRCAGSDGTSETPSCEEG